MLLWQEYLHYHWWYNYAKQWKTKRALMVAMRNKLIATTMVHFRYFWDLPHYTWTLDWFPLITTSNFTTHSGQCAHFPDSWESFPRFSWKSFPRCYPVHCKKVYPGGIDSISSLTGWRVVQTYSSTIGLLHCRIFGEWCVCKLMNY